MEEVSARKPDEEGHSHGHGDQQFVQISVDGQTKTVKKGKYIVSELKELVGAPPNYELDEVVSGEFVPLADDASVHIKGDETFVSHVRRGGSS